MPKTLGAPSTPNSIRIRRTTERQKYRGDVDVRLRNISSPKTNWPTKSS